MDKKIITAELIIKAVFALFAIVACIFILTEMISLFPLYKSFSYTENDMYKVIFNTHFGDIFKEMGIFEAIDSKVVLNGLSAFIHNVSPVAVLFLFMALILMGILFMFPKWKLISDNLIISLIIIGLYLFKYILFGVSFLIFYKDNLQSVALSLIVGTAIYQFFSVIEIAAFFLFIIKFIFNVVSDVKLIYSIEN